MDRNLPPEAERYLPLVKNIVFNVRRDLGPELDAVNLMRLGEKGLADGFAQFRSRQGLSLRTYLTYRIQLAIFEGLAGYDWTDKDTRRQYLFQKKSSELLLHFHLSAEGSVKRSTQAEQQEICYLLQLLAIVALLLSSDLSRIIPALDPVQQKFVDLYYVRNLTMEAVAEEIGISPAAANRLHIKLLEKIAAAPPRSL